MQSHENFMQSHENFMQSHENFIKLNKMKYLLVIDVYGISSQNCGCLNT